MRCAFPFQSSRDGTLDGDDLAIGVRVQRAVGIDERDGRVRQVSIVIDDTNAIDTNIG